MEGLEVLQEILKERLPYIGRWKKVYVYKWDDENIPSDINPKKDMFYIYWNGVKGENIHPFEHKEIPISDLETIIGRNIMRLKNKTKTHE